jgi:hypothetical protein
VRHQKATNAALEKRSRRHFHRSSSPSKCKRVVNGGLVIVHQMEKRLREKMLFLERESFWSKRVRRVMYDLNSRVEIYVAENFGSDFIYVEP